MMVPKSVSWHRMVFKYHGTELPRTKWRILGVFILSCAVTSIEIYFEEKQFDLHVVPFTLTGVALSIFLGFRNNAAYDRWWEGRKLWGAAVNTTRSFARQILTLIGPGPDGTVPTEAERAELKALQKELVYRIIAWTHALRLALRDQDDLAELAPFLSEAEIEVLRHQSNRPYAISQGTGERLRKAYDRGWIHAMHLSTLEASLVSLTDIQGACERIKSTPIPYSYNTLIHRIVAVYCYGLPFGLVSDVGAMTPVVVLVVAYAFFGIDTVGDEIEQPFGTDPNDLPLTAISRTIEVNLRQRLDDQDIPPLLRPVNEILQ
jgi:ion channel-forming bestrophin family protein